MRISRGCDDGNLVNGDGCSANCAEEFGYACNEGSDGLSVCTENVRPELRVTQVSEDNVMTVQFSEYVKIMTEDALDPDNWIFQITGPNGPYTFTPHFHPVGNATGTFEVGDEILYMQISLTDVASTFVGFQQEEFSFQIKYSHLIEDLAGNNIMKMKNSAYLQEHVFISPGEEAVINGSGESMKSSFFTVVALNLLLKLLLQSSMSALWGAVHAL